MKDSEIRKLIHDNMPQIEGSGRFMDELVRQIDLLPVPASLDGRSEEEKQANIRMILDVARSIKRRYRRSAILFAVLSVVLLSCAVLAIFLIPELHEAVGLCRHSPLHLPLGTFRFQDVVRCAEKPETSLTLSAGSSAYPGACGVNVTCWLLMKYEMLPCSRPLSVMGLEHGACL